MNKHISKTLGVSVSSLLITLGIIYGDIGTSTLYTYKAIIGTKEITNDLVFGGVSCIFWTLFLQTTIKYVWLALRADNDGEGGIFSLFALVRRYRKKLIIPAMIGSAALLADGVITPAISVTSAIEGLGRFSFIDSESLNVSSIVIIIIFIIFFMQRFGSNVVGKMYGPIMVMWFIFLFAIGIHWVMRYPAIINALNPYYAYSVLVAYPSGFWILGAVFLCTTGAEALYSDLGHCGKKSIRITWAFVKVCLVSNYLGQAAWLIHQDDSYLLGRNPFFEIIPKMLIIPGIIIATLAAIVASQALISGAFSLINEAINLNLWPKIAIKQPTESKGQVYIPSINSFLWICCTFVVIHFQTSSGMEAAYGLAITLAMLSTTLLLFYYLKYKLRWNLITVYLFVIIFLTIELSFFIANIVKFSDGGYITILIAGILFIIMYINYFGKKIDDGYLNFVKLNDLKDKILELSNDYSIPKATTHLIYLNKTRQKNLIDEQIIHSIFAKKPKRADVYWFFHIERTGNPYTLDYEVSRNIDNKIFVITLNLGFRIQPKTELYFKRIIIDLIEDSKLNESMLFAGSTKYNPSIDYKFIIIERFLSVQNEFALKEGLILKAYFLMKKYSEKDRDTYGLDKDSILTEQTPMLLHQSYAMSELKRK